MFRWYSCRQLLFLPLSLFQIFGNLINRTFKTQALENSTILPICKASVCLASDWLCFVYPVSIGPIVTQAPTTVGLLRVGKLTLAVNNWTICPQNYYHSNRGQISESFNPVVVLLHVTWRPRCLTGLAANQTSARAIAAPHIRIRWPVPVSLATVPSYICTISQLILFYLASSTASQILRTAPSNTEHLHSRKCRTL